MLRPYLSWRRQNQHKNAGQLGRRHQWHCKRGSLIHCAPRSAKKPRRRIDAPCDQQQRTRDQRKQQRNQKQQQGPTKSLSKCLLEARYIPLMRKFLQWDPRRGRNCRQLVAVRWADVCSSWRWLCQSFLLAIVAVAVAVSRCGPGRLQHQSVLQLLP